MSKKSQFSYERSSVSPTYLEHYREYFSDVEYLPKVTYSNNSRYSNLRTIKDKNTGNIYHEGWSYRGVPESGDDEFVTVNNETTGRLDLIAYSRYGSARYWWVIALANYIIDPFDVPLGTILRIPPLVSLYQNGGVLGG